MKKENVQLVVRAVYELNTPLLIRGAYRLAVTTQKDWARIWADISKLLSHQRNFDININTVCEQCCPAPSCNVRSFIVWSYVYSYRHSSFISLVVLNAIKKAKVTSNTYNLSDPMNFSKYSPALCSSVRKVELSSSKTVIQLIYHDCQ